MEELSLDNILSEDQIGSLFGGEELQENSDEETPEEENKSETEETTEINPNELFGESESVGSEENTGKEDTESTKSSTSSNFYSSIANALVEDGIFQNLDENKISNIKSAEDFAELVSGYIDSQLDERQRRVNDALNNGVEPTEIQKYERYLAVLDDISEDKIADESDEGENLRKNLIYQDCLNRGFSKERALKMVDKAFKAGTDIEDAKDALQDNKSFFKGQYESVLKAAKAAKAEEEKRNRNESEKLRTSILENEKVFGDITIDKSTRQKVYDSIMKPVYTDPETGEKLTAIQKYELENRTDFLKNIGLLFVLTDGFKNIDRLVTDKVKKETKKSLRSLEHTLKGTGNNLNGGTLTLSNNSGEGDPESLFKGWRLSV